MIETWISPTMRQAGADRLAWLENVTVEYQATEVFVAMIEAHLKEGGLFRPPSEEQVKAVGERLTNDQTQEEALEQELLVDLHAALIDACLDAEGEIRWMPKPLIKALAKAGLKIVREPQDG
jgi:uncharacterized protein (UPF0371 family)